ncbi:hypothetical protein ACSBOB_19555 [Mesorhizobium sp. ASY16-5R]|uniref:hypothetical protein n=1 Tax=Mesorhizobium sp. ASY16-5R TaxID=3445772 RepID=UPI003F9F1995
MDSSHNQRATQSPPTEDQGLHFRFVPLAGSTKLVIFFSDANAPQRSFHFWRPGLEARANRLFVNNGVNEWYQNGIPGLGSDLPTTIMNMKLWARRLGATEIYAVGQGMGGHGAVLYGSLLGARVLAFGAETTIRLPASRSERLLGPDAKTPFRTIHRFIAQASEPIYAFAGENDPLDMYCLALANGLPNYFRRSLNFVGGSPGSHLGDRNRLKPLLRAFLDNQPPPPMIEDGFGCEIEGFAQAYYELFVAHSGRDWAKAAEAGARATALNPASDFAQYMTGNAYLQLGYAESAVGHLSTACSLYADHTEYRWTLALCLRELGRIDLAIDLHRQLIRAHPDFAKSHYALSMIFMANGALTLADRHARRACLIEPKNAGYAKQAARAAQRLAKRRPGDIDKLSPQQRRIVTLYEKA